MRDALVSISRRLRPVFRAGLRRLSAPRRARLLTLAHYLKLVLLQGYTEPWAREAALDIGDPAVRAEESTANREGLLPDWVIDELRELARIEPDLYPTQEFVSRYHVWRPPVSSEPGDVFVSLAAQAGRRYDVVLACPYLKQGGADKGILQYLEHYRAKAGSVLLVTTLDEPSPWLGRVPSGMTVLQAGNALSQLAPDDQRLVLARLLLQWRPDVLHIVNSDLAWRAVLHHGRALRTMGCRIVASLFCDDYDLLGRPWSYAQLYLPGAAQVVDRIICDSEAYCLDLGQRYGLAPNHARPVRFHVPPPDQSVRPTPGHTALESLSGRPLLWAGRLCRQKRPDLVVEIARMRPQIRIRVFGTPEDDLGHGAVSALSRLPNVELLGAFNGLAQAAATTPHAALLYTTQWDGLPNVLLEAASLRLPIIAGRVGGVGDFIDDTTGYLAEPAVEAAAYCMQIDRLLSDPVAALARARAAADRVARLHSHTSFAAAMDEAVPWVRAAPTRPRASGTAALP